MKQVTTECLFNFRCALGTGVPSLCSGYKDRSSSIWSSNVVNFFKTESWKMDYCCSEGGIDHCKRFFFLTPTVKFTFRNFEAICILLTIYGNDYPPAPCLVFEGFHLTPVPDLVENKAKNPQTLSTL